MVMRHSAEWTTNGITCTGVLQTLPKMVKIGQSKNGLLQTLPKIAVLNGPLMA